MDVAAAFASGLVGPAQAPIVAAPAATAATAAAADDMDVDGGSSEEPQPAVPVHVAITITEGGAGAIDFGLDHVSPALLVPRPRLDPGMQVVQLTITGGPSQMDDDEVQDKDNNLSVVHEEVARSIPTVRSVAVRKASREDASGIVGALIPQEPSRWRVVPNIVSLLLSDIGGADAPSGPHPIRTIGQAMEIFNQLPALQELVFLNCKALEADVVPLAAALKKGNAPQLRVLNYGNNQQLVGDQESASNLLLRALASGARPRHRIEVLSFADNWSFVNASLTSFRGALKACPGLRKLNIDSSKRPVFEVLDLAYAIAAGEVPRLEYVCLTVPVVAPKDEPWKAIEILTRAAASKTPPTLLEVRLA